jgi:hypothetical protein
MPFKQIAVKIEKTKSAHPLKVYKDNKEVRQDRWVRKSDLNVDLEHNFLVKKLKHKFVLEKQVMGTP